MLVLCLLALTFLPIIPNGLSRSEGRVYLALGQETGETWLDVPAGDHIIFFEMDTYDSLFNCSCWVTELSAYIWENKTSSEGSFRVYAVDTLSFIFYNTDSVSEGTLHYILEERIIESFSPILIIGITTISIVFIIIKSRGLAKKSTKKINKKICSGIS